MIELFLIGIGTGNPDHLTAQAVKAMNGADLILLPRKGDAKSDLIDLRRTICSELLTEPVRVIEFDMPVRDAGGEYIAAVNDWHDAIASVWRDQIMANLPSGGRLALLIWGDPSLYDSTLRIAERLARHGLDLKVHVVPGITSIQALTAAHAIPLNPLAGAVTILTGRMLRTSGWPSNAEAIVVMLDGSCAFTEIDPTGVSIWWGAYLGMGQEAIEAGQLAIAGPQIVRRRAALREKHGWIMDVYMLKKSDIAE